MKRTLSLLCALGSLLGCEASSIENEPLPPPDDGAEAAKDARTPGPTRDAGRADAASVQRADAGTGSERGDDAATPEGMTEPDPADAEPLAPDAGSGERPEASAESKIAGSAAANDCSSYGERSGDRCYGFWCGVSAETIATELQAGGPCVGLTPEMLCEGSVQTRLQTCAISIRTDLLNLLDSEEALRTKIQDCFYEEPAFEPIGQECLGCFLAGGECAGRNCVTECLASEGRSAACDQCRFEHNCFQPLPACAGIPSPF